jgi:hypothetical protein
MPQSLWLGDVSTGSVPLAKRGVVKRTPTWNERAPRLTAHRDRSNRGACAWIWLSYARILATMLPASHPSSAPQSAGSSGGSSLLFCPWRRARIAVARTRQGSPRGRSEAVELEATWRPVAVRMFAQDYSPFAGPPTTWSGLRSEGVRAACARPRWTPITGRLPAPEQRFVGIGVASADDPVVAHQGELDRRAAALCDARKVVAVEHRIEGLRSKPGSSKSASTGAFARSIAPNRRRSR